MSNFHSNYVASINRFHPLILLACSDIDGNRTDFPYRLYCKATGEVVVGPATSNQEPLPAEFSYLATLTLVAYCRDYSRLDDQILQHAVQFPNQHGRDAFRIDRDTPVQFSYTERAAFIKAVKDYLLLDLEGDGSRLLPTVEHAKEVALPPNSGLAFLTAAQIGPAFIKVCEHAVTDHLKLVLNCLLTHAGLACRGYRAGQPANVMSVA